MFKDGTIKINIKSYGSGNKIKSELHTQVYVYLMYVGFTT